MKLRSFSLFFTIILLTFVHFNCSKPTPATQGKLLTITASSTLKDAKDSYNVDNVFDNTEKTWCEGKADDGIGESFEFGFEKEVLMQSIFVKNGFGDPKFYALNNRIEKMKITSEKGESVEVKFEDTNSEKEIALKTPLTGTKFTFSIVSVYPGSKYKDTCLTEIGFMKSDIQETFSTNICGVNFKELEFSYYYNNVYQAKISFDASGSGYGTYRSYDIGCSEPEEISFESVTLDSSEEGKVTVIRAIAGSNSNSVEANCAPSDINIHLDSCVKGIEQTKWDGLDCQGKLQGSKITIDCH